MSDFLCFVLAGYGVTSDGHTTYINASTCTLRYQPINPPVIFELPLQGTTESNSQAAHWVLFIIRNFMFMPKNAGILVTRPAWHRTVPQNGNVTRPTSFSHLLWNFAVFDKEKFCLCKNETSIFKTKKAFEKLRRKLWRHHRKSRFCIICYILPVCVCVCVCVCVRARAHARDRRWRCCLHS